MAVEISWVTQCPSDDLITGAWLDYPQTGPVDGYTFDVSGWVVSKAPVAEVQFVHEQRVVACCELTVTRPDVAALYGSSSQVGFCKAIRTVGLAPAFTIEVRVVFQDGRQDVIAEIRGKQQLTSAERITVDLSAPSTRKIKGRHMPMEISGVDLCLSNDPITAAWLDRPRTGPVDRYAFEVSGWVVSKAPVAEVEFVHEQSVVASCELTVSRPDVAREYGSSSSVGFWAVIGTVGLASAFTIEVRVVFQDGRRHEIAEIRGTQQLTSGFVPSMQPIIVNTLGRSGGTWLMRMLAEHPDIIVHERFPYETYVCSYWMHFLQVLVAPVDTSEEESLRFWRDPKRLPPFPYFFGQPFVRPTPTEDVAVDRWYFDQVEEFARVAQAAVESFYREYARRRKRITPAFFAEKIVHQKGVGVGHYHWTMRLLYPRLREIFLVRDPRDTLASVLAFNARRGFDDFGRERVETDEQYIDVIRTRVLSFVQTWKRRSQYSTLVRYEDLVRSPTEQIRAMLDALELDSSANIVEAMVKAGNEVTADVNAHRTSSDARSSVGRWKRDLEPRLQKICDEAFGGLLDELDASSC